MDWEKIDWKSLKNLRKAYIGEPEARAGDYWDSDSLLEAYDATFAERIGWKWRAVLNELSSRGHVPEPLPLLDWGCGTGIASRTWTDVFGATEVAYFDRSARAASFAARRLKDSHDLAASVLANPPAVGDWIAKRRASGFRLVVSHVWNEVNASAATKSAFESLLLAATEVIWVEPGTHDISRALSKFRDGALFPGGARILGPCTHFARCGMLSAGNERHWCHAFAEPDPSVHHDRGWRQFAIEIGIDLRSVPYAYLAWRRIPEGSINDDDGASRVIGRPRVYKGYSRVQTCHGQLGVGEFTLQKRDAPELWKRLRDLEEVPFFRFEYSGDRIVSTGNDSND